MNMSVNYVFLTQLGNYTVPPEHDKLMKTFTLAGGGCSFAGCMLIQFTWIYLGLGNDNFFITGNLATILLTAQAAILGLENWAYPDTPFCIASTIALVYLNTSVFAWMFLFACVRIAECSVGLHGSKHYRRIMYIFVGYAVPCAGIIPIAIYYPEMLVHGEICWLTGWTQWIFMGPVYAILAFNHIAMLISLYDRWSRDGEKDRMVKMKIKIRNILLLFFAESHCYGTGWIFGLMPIDNYKTLPFSWIYIIYTIPQCFYMFLFYYCTHQRVIALLAAYYEDTVQAILAEIWRKKARRGLGLTDAKTYSEYS